jgi:hypothetical protein
MSRLRLPAVGLAIAATLVVAAAVPTAAAGKACGKINNPYPGTSYEGIDLKHIRAEGVSCKHARRITRKAHFKALGQSPSPGGILRLRWRGWQVRGNLIPDHDRYAARKNGKRVRWVF